MYLLGYILLIGGVLATLGWKAQQQIEPSRLFTQAEGRGFQSRFPLQVFFPEILDEAGHFTRLS